MAERGRTLDERVIGHEGPAVAVTETYISGEFPDAGQVVNGWTGPETVIRERVFDPCGKGIQDEYSPPPVTQTEDT